MDNIVVIPLCQVGSVPFQSNREIVREAFGEFREFRKNQFSKNTADDFGFCHVYYDENDNCDAFEFFSGCKIEVDGKIVFPGRIDAIKSVLGDYVIMGDSYISIEKSIGITVINREIECVLFGKKDYYKSMSQCFDSE